MQDKGQKKNTAYQAQGCPRDDCPEQQTALIEPGMNIFLSGGSVEIGLMGHRNIVVFWGFFSLVHTS
jgi:hypothetical protein